MASDLPLLHFEPDPHPDRAEVGGIKCDFVIEYQGVYYRCQLWTGTYTSTGHAARVFTIFGASTYASPKKVPMSP